MRLSERPDLREPVVRNSIAELIMRRITDAIEARAFA
jgi:hypothetical protein